MEIANHECYVSLEVAKLLKKAGFDWECKMIHFCYVEDDYMWNLEDNDKKAKSILKLDYCLLAPTLDVAQRWLREVKNVWIEVLLVNATDPHYRVDLVNSSKYNNSYGIIHYADYKVYEVPEEAQEAGIKKALEMILDKGE